MLCSKSQYPTSVCHSGINIIKQKLLKCCSVKMIQHLHQKILENYMSQQWKWVLSQPIFAVFAAMESSIFNTSVQTIFKSLFYVFVPLHVYSTHAVEDLSTSSEECQLKDLNYVFAVDITSPALGKILLRTLAVFLSYFIWKTFSQLSNKQTAHQRRCEHHLRACLQAGLQKHI